MNKRKKVLLVDDEVELLAIMALNFEYSNYECFTAANAIEAERILLTENLNLVICDLIMPNVDGIELFTKMKERMPTLPPFYFCSGLNDWPFSKPYPAGIIGFIRKPFPVNELLEEVSSILGSTKLSVSL